MAKVNYMNVGKRMSDIAIHNGTVYLAGKVPHDLSQDMYGQTHQILKTIDELLAQAGSSKDSILLAQVFVANINEFAAMNKAWDEWVSQKNAPPRVTIESRLASADVKVEIVVTAAVES